jgi:hypothetical protein
MIKGDFILKNLSNIPGWITNRRIVVFESDDWGSIRMPSRDALERLQLCGEDLISSSSARYNLFDHFASAEDLSSLFDVLGSIKDIYNNHAVFTAISLVANPDFEKIKQSNFNAYYFEPFTESFKRFKHSENSFVLWKEGIRNRLFVPQFHGREHLNVAAWMRSLQRGDIHTLNLFNENCWAVSPSHSSSVSFQAAFQLENFSDLEHQKDIVSTGLELFYSIMGYKATFFVPPNGPFNNELENTAFENGIKYISVAKIQKESFGNNKIRRRFHWLGQKNRNNQIYITRNCFFEPSLNRVDWVDSCLRDIDIAFRWNKPAIISSHRVNYIGIHDSKNRDRGLNQLNNLLHCIVKKWPKVEFMTSDQLGSLINKT